MTRNAFVLDKVCLEFPRIQSYSIKDVLLTGSKKGGDRKPALHDISFEVEAGEAIGLVGHNGAGKTTLLRVMSGVYPVTSGQVIVNCIPGSFLALGVGLNNEVTARQHISFKLVLIEADPFLVTEEKIEQIVDYAELVGFEDEPLRTFSAGMLARLEFSILVHTSFDFILMDEWLSVGDASFKEKAKKTILNKMRKDGCGLILASHDENLISSLCSRSLHLSGGQIVAETRL